MIAPRALAALLALTLLGTDGAGATDTGVPASRLGSTPGEARYAYFSTAFLSTRGIQDRDLPPAHSEFEIGKDTQVTFIGAVNNPGRGFTHLVLLLRPDGTVQRSSTKRVSNTGSYNWFYFSVDYTIDDLRAHPGRWTAAYYTDDKRIATASFLLGDAKTLAELRKQPAPTEVAAARAPRSPVATPPAPAVRSPAPSSPPAVAQPAPALPVVRAPPAITLLEPLAGALLHGEQVTLKIEVKGEGRPKSLMVRGRGGDRALVPELYEYVEDQVDRAARLAGGRQRPLMKGEIEGTLPLSRTAR